jgi:hypothetical protein
MILPEARASSAARFGPLCLDVLIGKNARTLTYFPIELSCHFRIRQAARFHLKMPVPR